MKKFSKILKLLIIAILIFLIFGVVLTKCTNCKKESAVAYAEEANISLYSTQYINYDFESSLFTYPHINYIANNVIQSNGYLLQIKFLNLPLIDFTIEIVVNNEIWGNYKLFLTNESFSQRYAEFKNIGLSYANLTPASDGSNGNYLFLVTGNEYRGQDFNIDFYFYAGSYVPGYGQGLAAGLQQGNAEGYNKGVEDSQYGAFKGATVDIKLDYNDKPSQTFTNLIPNYVYQGINSLNLDDYYDGEYASDSMQYATFTINFKEPFLYDQNNNTLVFSGDLIGLTNYATIITPDNVYQDFDIVYEPSGQLLNEKINNILISKIRFTVGRPRDLGRWWLNSTNTGTADYNYGYNVGYKEGYQIGENIGGKGSYDKGFKEGEAQGYANAVAEGASAMGLFTGAVSFIKVFFQLLTSFLETKIAGDITLGLLVIGLPAAFMIVNLAIGLVKKLLGARGAAEGSDDS